MLAAFLKCLGVVAWMAVTYWSRARALEKRRRGHYFDG